MSSDPLLDRVFSFCSRMIPFGSSIVVGVSGGGDSLFLLHALLRLSSKLGISRLVFAHVNHGLRAQESLRDEHFVSEIAAALGLEFFVSRLDTSAPDRSGIEAWARRERYRFLHQVRREQGLDLIATGHTADDQAETVLMRLIRGCGLTGLRGIHPVRRDGVIRPILMISRVRIRQWLGENGVAFREDSSNSDTRFLRNRIRHEVMPLLAGHSSHIVDHLCFLAQDAQHTVDRLHPVTNKWQETFVMKISDTRFSISKDAFGDPMVAAEGVREIFSFHGISPDRGHIQTIIDAPARVGTTLLLPGGWRCIVARDRLEFEKEICIFPDFSHTLAVPGTTHCETGERFQAHINAPDPVPEFDPRCRSVFLDADCTGRRLLYRRVRPGDSFTPLGGNGPREIRRYLKNHRICSRDREKIGVVVNESTGQIVWIPGVQIADTVRLTPETTRALHLRYQSGTGAPGVGI